MMIGYRVDLAPDDNGSLLVTCPQLPMVATFGDTREDALSHALDAIETALASMIDDGEKIPRPKAADLRPITAHRSSDRRKLRGFMKLRKCSA